MCSFFLLERLRKDNEWFIAGTPVAHRPLVCVVWEYTSTDFQQAKLCRKCLCSITRAQNGLFVTSFLWIFSCSFSLCPFQGVFWLCSTPEGLGQEIQPNQGLYGFRAAEACNPHYGCYRTPCDFVQEPPSCSIHPDTQIRQILSLLTPFSDPCFVLCGIWTKSRTGRLQDEQWKTLVDQSCLERKVSWENASSWPFRSTGPHTSPMEWGHHFNLGNRVIFLRGEKVAWSLQSSNALVPN